MLPCDPPHEMVAPTSLVVSVILSRNGKDQCILLCR